MYRNDKNETHDQQEIHVRSVEHGICPIAELRVHDWTVRIVTEYRPRYGNFSIFQDGSRRHLGFLKFQIFNGRNG